MSGLTFQQARLLAFLKRCEETPSYEEMREALGLKSKSGIARLIDALEERGRIRRIPNRARAIMVVPEREDLSRVQTQHLIDELISRGFGVIPRAA